MTCPFCHRRIKPNDRIIVYAKKCFYRRGKWVENIEGAMHEACKGRTASKCLRCGYEWYPATHDRPRTCANRQCRSPWWDTPRTRKTYDSARKHGGE